MKQDTIEQSYELARERYAELGVDTAQALARLATIPVSMHCWQGDDVAGFEGSGDMQDGGIMATGNFPGKARSPAELKADMATALSLVPGRHRVNLHAIYAETGGKRVERDQLVPEHFAGWIDWARQLEIGLDFNPSFFAHPKAEAGYTLASGDEGTRTFWVGHGLACRAISAAMGKALGSPCVHNIWIPDGCKDLPADRKGPRERLVASLDEILAEPLDEAHVIDALESKLFGLGSESYVVGSLDFYLCYAATHGKWMCLDTGHFHPTEVVSDKLSAVLAFLPGVLLHVSRGIRWDSDHVTTLTEEVVEIAKELVRGAYLDRVCIGTDFFDGSINRVAAWTIGMRTMIKALLIALLEPTDRLQALEHGGDFTGRLALLEELKTLPFGAVWDYYCTQQDVPVGMAWVDAVRTYENEVLSRR